MNTELQQELFDRLDAVAAKLGVAAEHLWEILIRQAQITAIQDIVLCVVVFVVVLPVAVFWTRRIRRLWRDDYCDYDEPIGESIAAIMVGVLGVVFVIAAFVQLYDIPTRLLNPEYWAFRELARLIGR